jgi:hypothetical protein
MAATKISDILIPDIWQSYIIERTAVKSALWSSGIVAAVNDITVDEGGRTVNMPFFQDLTGNSEVLSDSADLTVNKIGATKDVAAINHRGKAWGVNDLAGAMAGDDPMDAIIDLVATWWARDMQTLLISLLSGSIGAANMTGNVYDISALTAAQRVISGDSMIDAAAKLGDSADSLTGLLMHSAVEAKLRKLNLIDTELDSNNQPIKYYQGKRVIVDDGLTASSGTYTIYMFGPGAIGYAEGSPKVPVEDDRDSLAGEDILINRRSFVLHPRGIKWNPASGVPAGNSPTNAEFAGTGNWTRVYEAKNIRIVQHKFKLS